MANLSYASPCFIVADLKASVSFYVDRLGFEISYIGPEGDPFFAIVGRDTVSIMLKAVAEDIKPVPNRTRHPFAPWDAFIYAKDPDALFDEYRSRGLAFRQPIPGDQGGLRGFELSDADGYALFFGRLVSKEEDASRPPVAEAKAR